MFLIRVNQCKSVAANRSVAEKQVLRGLKPAQDDTTLLPASGGQLGGAQGFQHADRRQFWGD